MNWGYPPVSEPLKNTEQSENPLSNMSYSLFGKGNTGPLSTNDASAILDRLSRMQASNLSFPTMNQFQQAPPPVPKPDFNPKDFMKGYKEPELTLNDPLYFKALIHCLGQVFFKYCEAAYPVLGVNKDSFIQTVSTPFTIANSPTLQLLTYSIMAMGCAYLGDRKQGDEFLIMAQQAAAAVIAQSPSYEAGCGYTIVAEYFRSIGKTDDANYYVHLASNCCQQLGAYNTNLHKRVLFGMSCATKNVEDRMKVLEELKAMLSDADQRETNFGFSFSSTVTHPKLRVGIDLVHAKAQQLCIMLQEGGQSPSELESMMQVVREEEERANTNSTLDPIVKMQTHILLIQARSFIAKAQQNSTETPVELGIKDATYIGQLLRKSNFPMCDFAILLRGVIQTGLTNLHNKAFDLLEHTYSMVEELAKRFEVLVADFQDLDRYIAEANPGILLKLKAKANTSAGPVSASPSLYMQNESLLSLLNTQGSAAFLNKDRQAQQFASPSFPTEVLQGETSGVGRSAFVPGSHSTLSPSSFLLNSMKRDGPASGASSSSSATNFNPLTGEQTVPSVPSPGPSSYQSYGQGQNPQQSQMELFADFLGAPGGSISQAMFGQSPGMSMFASSPDLFTNYEEHMDPEVLRSFMGFSNN